MGLFDSFFSKDNKTTSTNTTQANLPDWMRTYLDQNTKTGMSQLEQMAGTTADQRIQGFTPDELAAQERIRTGTGQYDDIIGTALSGLQTAQGKAMEGVNQEDIQKFMNPYTQNVTDITKREATKDADIARLKAQSQGANVGAFGGSGSLIRQMELDNGLQQNLSDIQYKGQADAYNSALAAARQSTADTIAAGGAIGNLATTGANIYNTDTKNLAASGEAQRGLEQTKTDFTYTNPLQTTLQGSQLINANSGLYGTTSQGTQVTPGAGWGSQLLGMGVAAAGIASGNPMAAMGGLSSMMGTNSQPMSPAQSAANGITWNPSPYNVGFKDGGAVNMADGGEPKSALDKLNLSERLNAFADTRLADFEKNGSLLGNLLGGTYKVDEADNRLESIVKAPAKAIAGAAMTPKLVGEGLLNAGSSALGSVSDYLLKPYSEIERDKKIAEIKKDEYIPGTVMPMPSSNSKSGNTLQPPMVDGSKDTTPSTPSDQMLGAPDFMSEVDKAIGNNFQNPLEAAQTPIAQSGLEVMKSPTTSDGSLVPEKEKSRLQKMLDDTNLPLLKAGLAMMASDKPFFEAVGSGGLVGAEQISKEREQEALNKKRDEDAKNESLDRQLKQAQIGELIKNNAERRDIARMRLSDAQERTKIAQQNADIYASRGKSLTGEKKLAFDNLKTQLKNINDRINSYTVSPEQMPSLEQTQQQIIDQMNKLTSIGSEGQSANIQDDVNKQVDAVIDGAKYFKK